MLTCFFLCQISTTKQQCVTYVTPFHITATQFPNQNPHELGIWTHREPIKLRGNSEFLFTFFLLCFFLAIVGFGFVGVFFVTGIIGGFYHRWATAIELKQISHRCRQPGTNKMERFCGWRNKEVWVSAGLFGIGFRFLVFALCLSF